MRPKFQADNDLRAAIRTGVVRREPAIDFQSAQAAQLDGVDDSSVLRFCALQARILISHDENLMPGHLRDFLAAGHRSPGVLLVSQRLATSDAIESILLIWLASEAKEWEDRLIWLPI